jgi:histone H3/H4
VLIPVHALREIKHYQKSTALLIPQLSFSRVVRECIQGHVMEHLHLTSSALGELQASAEKMLVLYFELMNKAAIHAKRVTIMQRDHTFVQDFVRAVDPTHPLSVEATLEQKKGPKQAAAIKYAQLRQRGENEKADRIANASRGKWVGPPAGVGANRASNNTFVRNRSTLGRRGQVPTARKTVPKGGQGI